MNGEFRHFWTYNNGNLIHRHHLYLKSQCTAKSPYRFIFLPPITSFQNPFICITPSFIFEVSCENISLPLKSSLPLTGNPKGQRRQQILEENTWQQQRPLYSLPTSTGFRSEHSTQEDFMKCGQYSSKAECKIYSWLKGADSYIPCSVYYFDQVYYFISGLKLENMYDSTKKHSKTLKALSLKQFVLFCIMKEDRYILAILIAIDVSNKHVH